MRRLIALAGVSAVLGTAAPALAAGGSVSSSLYSFSGPPVSHLSVSTVPARVSGVISVSFGPDPRTGCTALDGCGYRGSLVTNPGTQATLSIQRFVQAGRPHVEAQLILGNESTSFMPITYENVQRAGSGGHTGSCADETQTSLGGSSVAPGGGLYAVSLSGLTAATRCAGPLPSDLEPLLPTVRLARQALLRGARTLDFRTARGFASHGFAGTLTSTIVIRLGHPRPENQPSSSNVLPPGIKTVRERIVTEKLTVGAASGSLDVGFKGTPNTELCLLLDSCGVAGTLRLAPAPESATTRGSFTAIGPAKRPYRDFLAALGLSSRGRAAGISVVAFVRWADAGSVSAQLTQPGSCSDSGPLGGGFAALAPRPRGVLVYYTFGTLSLDGSAGPRTRCPGPELTGKSLAAVGLAPRSVLRRRSFTVTLTGRGSFSDDGYAGAMAGQVRLTFRRGRISQQIFSVPGGF